jgi:hypothetical protein
MKTSLSVILLAGVLCASALLANAADKRHLGGPKGGRFLEKTEPRAEFFVEKDRAVTIHFYDAALKPVPASTQTVTVIAETQGRKEKLEFEKKGEVLVSKGKLPAGEGYNVVLQFKQTPESKPQNFRFKLETHICAGCSRAEYGCTCDE